MISASQLSLIGMFSVEADLLPIGQRSLVADISCIQCNPTVPSFLILSPTIGIDAATLKEHVLHPMVLGWAIGQPAGGI